MTHHQTDLANVGKHFIAYELGDANLRGRVVSIFNPFFYNVVLEPAPEAFLLMPDRCKPARRRMMVEKYEWQFFDSGRERDATYNDFWKQVDMESHHD